MSQRRDVDRREFLGTSTAAGAAVVFGPGLLAAQTEAPQVPRRVLGKTGKTIPILLMGGAMQLDRRFDPRLAECVRYGVNYFDAAHSYAGGTSEVAMGAFLKRSKARDKVWVTTKSQEHEPKAMVRLLEQSLKRLQTDHVDMLYLHALVDDDYLSTDLAKTVEALKKQGKIKHFGFSCHNSNVAELLQKGATLPWIESIMFRYNFRQYGNKELNAGIDACAKANVGLIAMKTQGSEVSFRDAWRKFQKVGKWNKHQAVLKAVWADARISAAVSHMDSLTKVRDNIAVALDKTELGALEVKSLKEYAQATRSGACDGCDHLCGPAVDAPVRIGDTMRYLMYHDVYGQEAEAQARFAQLPVAAQRLEGVDFTPADRACPNGVDVSGLMRRAASVLKQPTVA